MTAEILDPMHPVATTVASVRGDLASVVGTPVWSMTTAETESALVEVARLATQVAQLQLRLLAHADRVEVGARVGATSATNWFAHTTRTTRPTAHRAARLASRLEAAHPAVDAALADASVNLDQAAVIVEAVDAEEARRLEADESAARAAASFTMSDDGHGQCHGRFTLPSLHGSMLRKALIALAAP